MNAMTLTAIVIILTTGTLLTGGCAAEEEKQTLAPVAVRTDLPEYRALAERIDYLGQVYATLEIQILSQLQGSIVSIVATDGERVRKGAELVRLSVPDLEANVERLRAERDYWCQRHEADERLLERNAVPADQVNASRRACNSADAALREAESRRAKAVEHAPFDGIVLRRFAEAGQNVMPGQALVVIGNNEREIRVDVVEEDLRRGIKVGMNAILSINGTT
ncbi:MAG: efflux RND transporter periplasmic adaptor subunit, partial [Bacteroidetes bacterium]|nr:efflux RND transporter periplasmic adaptor subunit [Bacteroidota bacterium]